MEFQKDLKLGKSYETLFIETYLKNAKEINHVDGKFSLYDILADGIKYEVKSDRQTHRTKNVCIEYLCSDKHSGIGITEADFYAYYVIRPDNKHDLYVVPTDYIKNLIAAQKYSRDINGGDGYRAKMYLFDLDYFVDFLVNEAELLAPAT